MSKESRPSLFSMSNGNALSLLFIAFLTFFFFPTSTLPGHATRYAYGMAALIAGIGLLRCKRSAHLLASLVYLGATALFAFQLLQPGSRWLYILWTLVGMAGTYQQWRDYQTHPDAPASKQAQEEEEVEPVSMVLWLKEPRTLSAYTLSKYLSTAWNREFTPLDTDTPDAPENADTTPIGPFVGGSDPLYMASDGSTMFLIHNMPHPYLSDPKAVAKDCSDMRMATAILENQAWISIDVSPTHAKSDARESFYPLMARFISECHHSSCLALYLPQKKKAYPWLDEVREALLAPDPLAALDQVYTQPILPIDHDDADMQAAVATAQQRWPEFVEAFSHRTEKDMFAIKFPLTDQDHTEFIWLNVEDLREDKVIGTLGNEPAQLPKYQIGDRMEVPTTEVIDWIVGSDDNLLGGFTTKVLMAKSKSKK